MNELFKEIHKALQQEGEWKGVIGGRSVEVVMCFDGREYSELIIDGVYIGDLYNFIDLKETLESIEED